jgi:hypothetical protein
MRAKRMSARTPVHNAGLRCNSHRPVRERAFGPPGGAFTAASAKDWLFQENERARALASSQVLTTKRKVTRVLLQQAEDRKLPCRVMPRTLTSATYSKTTRSLCTIKTISRSEMTAFISDSLIRRGAELARRRIEIAASRMASKRMRCADRICQPWSTRFTRIVARERTYFCA